MTRRPARTVQLTLLTMLVLQTIGTVDINRKMPSPRQYGAIGVLWGILTLGAETEQGQLAAHLSVLTLVTASVLGPFGSRLVTFLGTVSTGFGGAAATTGAGVAPTAGTTPSPAMSTVSAPASVAPLSTTLLITE